MEKAVFEEQEIKQAQRIAENFGKDKTKKEVFYHLCFAICAPQTTFVSNRQAVEELKAIDFYCAGAEEERLWSITRRVRFYKNKARYLIQMRSRFDEIYKKIRSTSSGKELRSYLVTELKGVGMKAASHFCRNYGFQDIAIIDVHILKFLESKTPKNNREYLQMEDLFTSIAENMGLPPVVLDALIWQKQSNTDWDNYDY